MDLPDLDHVRLHPAATEDDVAEACSGLARLYSAMLRPADADALFLTSSRMGGVCAADLNAQGCCHRRCGNISLSVECLQQALHLSDPTDAMGSASIHLNLGAALSALDRHHDALDQANAAVILLQGDIFSTVTLPLQQRSNRNARALREALELADCLSPDEIVRQANQKLAAAEEKHYHERTMHAMQMRDHDEVQRLKMHMHDVRVRQAADTRSYQTAEQEIERLCNLLGLQPGNSPAPDTPCSGPPVRPDPDSVTSAGELDPDGTERVDAKVRLLAIAYHNSGISQEALRRGNDAVHSLINATSLVQGDSPLSTMIRDSRDSAAREHPGVDSSVELASVVQGELRRILKKQRLQLQVG